MTSASLREVLAAHAPANWRELDDLLEPSWGGQIPIWDYASRACMAFGGELEAPRSAAALYCAVASVRLADDILDNDPNGKQVTLGVGRAANLALTLQALGASILLEGALPLKTQARVCALYLRACMATGLGQELDALGVSEESEYWRVVDAKTPPLISAAFEIGALFGRAAPDAAARLAACGRTLGLLIQVSDDLSDALSTPAKDDWRRPKNNLALLYASSVDHPERAAFEQLLKRSDELECLAAAQEILTRSGAVSYCAFKMSELASALRAQLDSVGLPQPAPIEELFESCCEPLRALFAVAGDREACGV